MNTINEYVKRHSAIISAIVVAIITFVLFLKLSEDVWNKESIINFDQSIANWAYSLRTTQLTAVMKFITSLASAVFIGSLFILLSVAFVYEKKWKHVIPLALTIAGSYLFAEIVKVVFARQRPIIEHALVTEKTFSYPSGHSLIAITFYGVLAIYATTFLKNKVTRLLFIALSSLLVMFIGFSRIYLGVHWASDVLGSYLIGTTWLCIVSIGINYHNLITAYLCKIFQKGSR